MVRIRLALFLLLFAFIGTVAFVREVDYSKCGTEKGCVFLQGKEGSERCGKDDPDSCTLSFTYVANPNREKVEIELTVNTGKGGKYAALGFSDDDTVGKDYVVFCDAENGKVTLAYNPENQPSGEGRTQDLAELTAATSVKVGEIEGRQIFVCRFMLATHAITEEFTEFKTISQKLQLYLAADLTASDDKSQISLTLKGRRGGRRLGAPSRPRATSRPKPPSNPMATSRPKPPSNPMATSRPKPATPKNPRPGDTGENGSGNNDISTPEITIPDFPSPFPDFPPIVIERPKPHPPHSPHDPKPHPHDNEEDDEEDNAENGQKAKDKAKSGSSAFLNVFLSFATLTALATSPLN